MTNRNIKDLTNRKFGYLTVTGDTGKRTKSGNVEWECKCVCGTNVYHTARHLKTKKDLSCGCSNPKQEEYFLKMVKMFKDNGCVCLEVGYKSARLKWRFKCVCGNIGNLYPSDFKNGKGETILDNCMGSGTTAIAAINTNRNYIGFELDEEYYSKSLERIEEHKKTIDTL